MIKRNITWVFFPRSPHHPSIFIIIQNAKMFRQPGCTASLGSVLSFPPNDTESIFLPAECEDRPERVRVDCHTMRGRPWGQAGSEKEQGHFGVVGTSQSQCLHEQGSQVY